MVKINLLIIPLSFDVWGEKCEAGEYGKRSAKHEWGN